MTTYNVFTDQLAAATDVADADQFLVYDASTGLNKDVTYAIMRGNMGGVVDTTATTLTITKALHAGKIVTISSAAPIAITLPEATGTGDRYEFFVAVAATATGHTIAALTTDTIAGNCFVVTTSSTNVEGFATSATSDVITMNGTTQGGIIGDRIVLVDVVDTTWMVNMFTSATGTEATPFSAT